MPNLFAILRGQPVQACMNVHIANRGPMGSSDHSAERSTARQSIQERHLIEGRRRERVFVRAQKELAFTDSDSNLNLL